MIQQQFNNSQDILNHFNGLGTNTSDVLIKKVLISQARINDKISVYVLAKRVDADPDCQIYVKLHSLNANKIYQILVGTTLTGAAIGAIFTSIFSSGFTVKGMGLGGTVGFGAGIGICLKKDLFSKAQEDSLLVKINRSQKMESFRNECSVEQYKLFKSFIDNYIKFVDLKSAEQIDEVLCTFTATIPDIPVFSPYDTQRLHVYEKEAIEQHLDNIDKKITRATLSGASQEVINQLRGTYCPYRGPAFTKNELVTDIRYINKVIDLIREILIPMKIRACEDPMLEKGLKCLLDHYLNQYNECSKTIVNKLFDDCIELGTPRSMIKEVCTAFENYYDDKKNI